MSWYPWLKQNTNHKRTDELIKKSIDNAIKLLDKSEAEFCKYVKSNISL